MQDLALLQIRTRPVFLLFGIYRATFLILFALFMVGGNFFRLLPLDRFPSHISLLEVTLYVWAFPLYFAKVRRSFLLITWIVFSCLYGALLHGFDLASSLYALKLIGMIGAGVALGEQFASRRELGAFLLKVFGRVVALGYFIFFVFPKAHLFFSLLEGYGVHFHGDPHMRRFISPFFDPNFYAAIACIPLILSWQAKRWPLFGAIFLSIVLTFSRSGIATAFSLLLAMLLSVRWKLNGQGLLFVLLLALPAFFPQEIFHLIARSVEMGSDPSALARLETFRFAIESFCEHPFFGTGYHYLSSSFYEASGRLSPDASMLILLTDFGLIPVLVMAFGACIWLINHFQRDLLFFYLAICILFTSLFNNLLLYPYWLIPVVAILTRKR